MALRASLSSRTLRAKLADSDIDKTLSPSVTACSTALDSDTTLDDLSGVKEIDADELKLIRYRDLWFTDGSVVLRAEDTVFRVHMSQLSRKSAFFRDLFSLPQPAPMKSISSTPKFTDGDIETLDGCPVLRLHDAAEDVINLLKALYDGPNFGTNDRGDFRAVAGILRLSSKYDIDSLREKALAHLGIAWPSTLKGWDMREDIARSYELDTGMHRVYRYPSPVAVIILAREIDAPDLLPSAFYDLSRYQYTQIFDPSDDEPLGCYPRASMLAPTDMEKLMLGKEASQQFVTSLIQGMASGSHREQPARHSAATHHRRRSSGLVCVTAAACRKDFSELVDLATQHYLFDRERGCSDPLYVAEELGQLKGADFSECTACARSLESWAARERERMWKLIPNWFRLQPYER